MKKQPTAMDVMAGIERLRRSLADMECEQGRHQVVSSDGRVCCCRNCGLAWETGEGQGREARTGKGTGY